MLLTPRRPRPVHALRYPDNDLPRLGIPVPVLVAGPEVGYGGGSFRELALVWTVISLRHCLCWVFSQCCDLPRGPYLYDFHIAIGMGCPERSSYYNY